MITRVSAKLYYGKHATGSVVLWYGMPIYHASRREVNEFLKLYYERNT